MFEPFYNLHYSIVIFSDLSYKEARDMEIYSFTISMLAILFASQFFGLHHAYGAAVLFIAATLLLGVALFRFAQEAWHARRELME